MLHISLKTENSFFMLSTVGLEEYSAHDWQAATSVQRAPVTWREWGLWFPWQLGQSVKSCCSTPVDDFCKLVCMMDMRPSQNILCFLEESHVLFHARSPSSFSFLYKSKRTSKKQIQDGGQRPWPWKRLLIFPMITNQIIHVYLSWKYHNVNW